MKFFHRFVIRWALSVSIIGTLFGLVGAYYSVLLYKNLHTDIEELLPTAARSVVDLNEVTRRLESIDNLAILVFSENTEASKRFVIDLAEKLRKLPKSTLTSAEYRIKKEIEFFRARQALYMELKDLRRVRDYVRDRLDYEKALYNPLNIFSEIDIPEPKLNVQALRQKYQYRISDYERFPDGFFASPDEKIRVILAYMPGKSAGIQQAQKLRDAIDQAIAELNPARYSSDLRVHFTGGVQNTLEEHHALIEDLELSTLIVMLLVTLGMLFFYKNIPGTTALIFSLLMGTLWTFGVSYFLVGYLNANSAFLGSIVIGNGINFGIIVLARYMEERRRGRNHTRAMRITLSNTARATLTAALAAGLSYGSLVLTGFRGFRQFGIIGLIGMVLCWISAFTLLPAYLTVLNKMRPFKISRREPKSYLSGGIASFVRRFPRVICGCSLALTALSLIAFVSFNSEIVETDLSKLRSKESFKSGSAFYSKYLDQIFQRYLSPLVILADNKEDAGRIAQKLKDKKKREGNDSVIASVQTLADFVPKDQRKKIEVLGEIKKLLSPRVLHRLSESDRKVAHTFLSPASFRPLREKDLPTLILDRFQEKDGTLGKMVVVEPPLRHETWSRQKLLGFIADIRQAADSVQPATPVAGTLAITSDMIDAISTDGPKATAFALLAVVVLVVVLFRSLNSISFVLLSLALGVTWMGGAIFGFGLKINFLNFIALPITFGIGVDYGVNIFQRYYQETRGDILQVIRHTGGAVGLCSYSTIVGYFSLLIAANRGFVSFGTLAVLGELTCVTAAVVSLPALLTLISRKKERKPEPVEQEWRKAG